MELGPLFTQLHFGRVKIDLTQSPRSDESWYQGGEFSVGCLYLSDGILLYLGCFSLFFRFACCLYLVTNRTFFFLLLCMP